jgi:hypothetical protein
LVERAITSTDDYDFMIDYNSSENETTTARRNNNDEMILSHSFKSSMTENRTVTSLDWYLSQLITPGHRSIMN